jgi:hypothetical protein
MRNEKRQIRFGLLFYALLFSLILTICPVSPSCGDDTIFRCGNETVSIGDSKLFVEKTCGKPDARERTGRKTKETGSKLTAGKKTGKSKTAGVETWSYNKGHGDFIYILTFEGGTLKKIEKGGRGK